MIKTGHTCILFCLAALMVCAAGCSTGNHTPHDPGTINHIVLITLNDPSDAAELQADCDEMLSTIPSVTVYACGAHVDAGRNAAVDDSYTLGLLVSFDDMPGYTDYLEHPGHLALLDKWKSRFASLKIYDIGNEPVNR